MLVCLQGEAMVIEKEESGGWLRVRTIMGGAYTPEEEEEKNSRHKLPVSYTYYVLVIDPGLHY